MYRSIIAALGLALSAIVMPAAAQTPTASTDPRAAAVLAALPTSFGAFTPTPGADFAVDSTDPATGVKSVSIIRMYSSGADMLTVSAIILTPEAIAAQADITASPDAMKMSNGKTVDIEGALAVLFPGAGLTLYPGHPGGTLVLTIGGTPETEWESFARAIDVKALAAIK